jgi:hypothetical protein
MARLAAASLLACGVATTVAVADANAVPTPVTKPVAPQYRPIAGPVRPVDSRAAYNAAVSAYQARLATDQVAGAAVGAAIGIPVGCVVGAAFGAITGLGTASIPFGILDGIGGCAIGAIAGVTFGGMEGLVIDPVSNAEHQQLVDRCPRVEPAVECAYQWSAPPADFNN